MSSKRKLSLQDTPERSPPSKRPMNGTSASQPVRKELLEEVADDEISILSLDDVLDVDDIDSERKYRIYELEHDKAVLNKKLHRYELRTALNRVSAQLFDDLSQLHSLGVTPESNEHETGHRHACAICAALLNESLLSFSSHQDKSLWALEKANKYRILANYQTALAKKIFESVWEIKKIAVDLPMFSYEYDLKESQELNVSSGILNTTGNRIRGGVICVPGFAQGSGRWREVITPPRITLIEKGEN